MRVRTYKLEIDPKSAVKAIDNPNDLDKDLSRRKFNASLEKKIERAWFEAKQLGWTYNRFVVCLFETLIVLKQRQKLRVEVELASQRKRQRAQ